MQRKIYKVRRFYVDDTNPKHRDIILRSVSRAVAERHCEREDTHAHDADHNLIWFDGWEEEVPSDYND